MSYQGRQFAEDRRTRPVGARRPLPGWLLAKMQEREACYRRLEVLTCYTQQVPATLPVGEYAWHEARQGR